MRCLPVILFALLITPPLCIGAEEKPKDLLFDCDELPRGRQEDCYAFFQKRFGEHIKKEGKVSRFDEGALYYEFRDFRVEEKKKETGYVSWLRVRSMGGGGFPNLSESQLKELEDTAHTLLTVEFTVYLAPDLKVKDVVFFLSRCLGVDKYTSLDEKQSGDQLLTGFLTKKQYGLLQVPKGCNINFGPPLRIEADADQPGHPVEVQVIVPNR